MKRRSTTSKLLRHINRAAVINLIRQEDVTSPTQIAAKLNVSIPTVMRVLEDLMEEDLVEYSGFGESTGGRRPARVKFKGSSYAVLGIDLGGQQLFGAVSDLSGGIQTEIYAEADDRDGDANLERLICLIEDLLRRPRPAQQKIRGIGVGVPSIVRGSDGHVECARKLHWHDLALKKILSERFQTLILVENNVNLAAVGEWAFGAGQGIDCLVCLVVGSGTGAGIMINGSLFRGHSNSAGEIGWLLHNESLCGRKFPRLGKPEELRDGPGIRARSFRILEMLDKRYAEQKLNLHNLFDPASVAQNPSLGFLNEMLDYLTLAVAGICTVLNPSTIILAGDIAPCAKLLRDCLRERLHGKVPQVPNIVISQLGHRAVAFGAITMVLDATTFNLPIPGT
jgi:predicted NBD/HSP70 family sugar kinase